MTIYDFGILSYYEFSGVDIAQGRRNRYFRELNTNVNYIFTDIVDEVYINRYKSLGIKEDQMLCAHTYMASNKDNLAGNYNVNLLLNKYHKSYPDLLIKRNNNIINLYSNNSRLISIKLKEDNVSIWEVSHFENEHLMAIDFYTDRLLYSNCYITEYIGDSTRAKKYKTIFYDENGNTAYETIENDEKSLKSISGYDVLPDPRDYIRYLFKDGKIIDKTTFLDNFLRKLQFKKDDVILIDRPMRQLYIEPLFRMDVPCPIVVFLHSGHYFMPYENYDALYWNKEYYYYFKHSNKINTFIVSTIEQKLDLETRLKEAGLNVPKIEVIPVSGIDKIEYSKYPRKKYSLITASRLNIGKRIDITIKAAIKAHESVPDLSLDIYGTGEESYIEKLSEIIKKNNATDYIHLMGNKKMDDKYLNYEVYISASIFETLGLSLMEACSYGDALIGFNARYGNKLFIKNNENGFLIDIDLEELCNDKTNQKYIDEMSKAIVNIFSDEEKLREYQNNSYKIVSDYMDEDIKFKWLNLISSLINIQTK